MALKLPLLLLYVILIYNLHPSSEENEKLKTTYNKNNLNKIFKKSKYLVSKDENKENNNIQNDDRHMPNIENVITYTDAKEKRDDYEFVRNILEENLNLKDNKLSKRSDDGISDNRDTVDYNETLCVGDPLFCNMTKEEYLEMIYEYIYPKSFEWVLIATHAIVFITGLIGNALVCIAVYRNHSMRTVTNYFIVNLAVADFLVILMCLPPTVLWDVTKTWFFGTAICRVVLYFQSVSVTVSVLTLTFISLDRWYAICYPLKFKSTTSRAKTAILIIWMISLLFNIPEFIILEVQTNIELRFNQQYFMQCTYTWSDESELTWHIIRALFLYTNSTAVAVIAMLWIQSLHTFHTHTKLRLPLVVMTLAYYKIVKILWRSDNIPGHTELHQLCPCEKTKFKTGTSTSNHYNTSTEGQLRSRRKAAKMMVAVVIMFAVCFFPVHLLCVLRVAYELKQSDVMTALALIAHVLCYLNSAVNPLIYNFMNGKFRHEFYRSYCKCFRCYTPPEHLVDRLGSARTYSKRNFVNRNDICVGYQQTTNFNSVHQDLGKVNTLCIENVHENRGLKDRWDNIGESARFTLNFDAKD